MNPVSCLSFITQQYTSTHSLHPGKADRKQTNPPETAFHPAPPLPGNRTACRNSSEKKPSSSSAVLFRKIKKEHPPKNNPYSPKNRTNTPKHPIKHTITPQIYKNFKHTPKFFTPYFPISSFFTENTPTKTPQRHKKKTQHNKTPHKITTHTNKNIRHPIKNTIQSEPPSFFQLPPSNKEDTPQRSVRRTQENRAKKHPTCNSPVSFPVSSDRLYLYYM